MPKVNKPAIPGYRYANPSQTSGKSLTPHPKEDVVGSQGADAERIRKGLDTAEINNSANRRRAQEAAGRAILRSASRAGYGGAALQGGYELGREIDERTGLGKKMVDKSDIGALVDKAATPKEKVKLTEDAKARLDEMENDRIMREVDKEIAAEKANKRDDEGYRKGGKVRGDGIAQRGKTRGRFV